MSAETPEEHALACFRAFLGILLEDGLSDAAIGEAVAALQDLCARASAAHGLPKSDDLDRWIIHGDVVE